MQLSGSASGTTVVNASGNYSFSHLGTGTYTVTPSKSGFTFSPASQTLRISSRYNQLLTANFTATPIAQTFTLSGTVSPISNGMAVTISLSGAATSTTTTDSSGNYVFSGLKNGSYTVTPAKTGFTFTPTVLTVSIAGTNVGNVNFTATANPPQTYSISGNINPVAAGSGATLTLGGAVQTAQRRLTPLEILLLRD